MSNILREIEGVFNGEKMITYECKEIDVPENYASKSKLLYGTKLVYRVTEDESFFKQLSSPEGMTAIGKVVCCGNCLKVEAEIRGIKYKFSFLRAFKFYFCLNAGDEVVVCYPENMILDEVEEKWCIIENVI